MLKHLFTLVMIGALCISTACSSVCAKDDAKSKVKYVFVLIGDGFGPNQRAVAEAAVGKQLVMNSGDVFTPTDTNEIHGWTTDSAASGTAIACGIKTYNGAIGVDENKKPVESLSAALKRERGFSVGIISSCGLSDATPAAQYAHQEKRSMRNQIIADLAKSNVDFVGGSLLLHCNTNYILDDPALPPQEKTYRKTLEAAGYTIYSGKPVKAALDAEYEIIKNNPSVPMNKIYAGCQPYVDWNQKPGADKWISIGNYLTFAAESFALTNKNGFFIMLECGWIDHSGHNNDSAWMIREVRAFDRAVATALEFQAAHPEETLVIVTADHETGGLQIVDAEKMKKNVHLLWKQKMRKDKLGQELHAMIKKQMSANKIIAKLKDLMGFDKFTAEQLAQIKGMIETNYAPKNAKIRRIGGGEIANKAAAWRDEYVGIKYTTGGHSNAKIITNAFGPGAELFKDPELKNSTLRSKIEQIIK